MITLFIIAAGLIGLSLILVTRESAALRVADQRGITLQTLIVTAVLVLMAVAAGVVIVAITNNANEDLEDQTTNLDSVCNEVEIYDPVLASQNIAPSNGGRLGSAPGCIPVCFWTAKAGDLTINDSDNIEFSRNFSGTVTAGKKPAVAAESYMFVNSKELFAGTARIDYTMTPMMADANFAGGVLEVRVGPGQNSCLPYDSRGNIAN